MTPPLAAALCAVCTLYAYRPFNGTDAAVADRGELELEVGPSGWLAEGRERYGVVPSLIVNYGIVPRVELVLEGRTLLSQPAPRVRLDDTAFSMKVLLREGSWQGIGHAPSVAIELGALLPTWETRRLGSQAALIVTERVPHVGAVHLNLATALLRSGSESAFAGLIVEGPFEWIARPVAEAFVEQEIGGDRATTTSLLGGVIWRVADAFDSDVGVRVAREDVFTVYEVRAGFTWGMAVAR